MAEYQRGTMEVTEQARTFSSFIGMSVWFGGLTVLTILFLALTFAAHVGWMVSLIITTIVGILMGLALGLKANWYATVIGFAAVSFFSAIIASLVGMML
ncbi:aa3-type cytochrome c oxidase subunit IV [Hyphobacterium sp.]|jgi:ATP/ADP translocase|uniref:aa3-type cytochrome c oxidase subunit IV n=1 Tax=Hyphobacterium sp. TaxID=2004662 RepID=UPI00374876FB